MYLGTRKYYNPEEHEEHRRELIKTKQGAIANTFIELEGLLSQTQVARQYFDRSASWLNQKIHSTVVFDRAKEFTEEEVAKLTSALRHIADRLKAHADEIDAAPME